MDLLIASYRMGERRSKIEGCHPEPYAAKDLGGWRGVRSFAGYGSG